MVSYPNKLEIIFDYLIKNGIKPVIVGGYVRDYFLNKKNNNNKYLVKDIDIELYNATSFDQIEYILKKFGNPNIIGKSFGVIKLDLDEVEIDFSLPRVENKISSGHKGFNVSTYPNLSYIEASSRRDFTINSIGFDVLNKKILDPHSGLKDLKKKKLKIVNEKTFVEDPLRILRAMQFCARFELEPDNDLIKIASNMCKKGLLNELAQERIYEEFKKLFIKSKYISKGLNFLKNVDGFLYFNELKEIKNSWQVTLRYIDNVNRNIFDDNTNITILLAILSYKMDQITKESFLNKITSKNSILRSIDHIHHVNKYLDKNLSVIKYSIVKDLNLSILIEYLRAKEFSKETLDKVKNIKPIVHGRDLIKIGMKKSKDFKDFLQLLYELQINKNFS